LIHVAREVKHVLLELVEVVGDPRIIVRYRLAEAGTDMANPGDRLPQNRFSSGELGVRRMGRNLIPTALLLLDLPEQVLDAVFEEHGSV